jgi:hypothetical protein
MLLYSICDITVIIEVYDCQLGLIYEDPLDLEEIEFKGKVDLEPECRFWDGLEKPAFTHLEITVTDDNEYIQSQFDFDPGTVLVTPMKELRSLVHDAVWNEVWDSIEEHYPPADET